MARLSKHSGHIVPPGRPMSDSQRTSSDHHTSGCLRPQSAQNSVSRSPNPVQQINLFVNNRTRQPNNSMERNTDPLCSSNAAGFVVAASCSDVIVVITAGLCGSSQALDGMTPTPSLTPYLSAPDIMKLCVHFFMTLSF